MFQKNFIGNSKVAKQKDNLTIKIALREGGATNDLEVVIITLELYLAITQLDILLIALVLRMQVVISYKDTFGTAKPNLIGTTLMQIKFFVDHPSEFRGYPPAAITKGVFLTRVTI